jgi:hypothetical protein
VADLLIPQGLLAMSVKENGRRASHSKGLAGGSFAEQAGGPKLDEADVLIPHGLLTMRVKGTAKGLVNLKDLVTVLPPSGEADSSGFVGLLNLGVADLLIPLGLLAKRRRRSGGGLLNLKDLLTVVSAEPKAFI